MDLSSPAHHASLLALPLSALELVCSHLSNSSRRQLRLASTAAKQLVDSTLTKLKLKPPPAKPSDPPTRHCLVPYAQRFRAVMCIKLQEHDSHWDWGGSKPEERTWHDTSRLPALQHHLVRLFQAPWLGVVKLELPQLDPASCALIASACLNTTELTLGEENVAENVAICAMRLPHLRRVCAGGWQCGSLDHAALNALAGCSALAELSFNPLRQRHRAHSSYLATLWSITTLEYLSVDFYPQVNLSIACMT